MPNVNQVTLAGHLCRDPELRFVGANASSICQLSIAVNEGKPPNQKAFFFDVKCWHGTARLVAERLKKGAAVVITGKLEQETWTDKDTQKQRSKVVVMAFTVASPYYEKKDGTSSAPSKIDDEDVPTNLASAVKQAGAKASVSDDDVPF